MKTYPALKKAPRHEDIRGVEVELQALLTSALGVGTHWIRGCVGPRAGPDVMLRKSSTIAPVGN